MQGNANNSNNSGSQQDRKQKDTQSHWSDIFYLRLKKFYMKDFHGLIHMYKRSRAMSIFIIAIIEMQTISLSF